MLVANFTSRIPTMGDTKTYEDWSKYIGVKPHSMGVVARMYTDNTLSYIMQGLRNVYLQDNKPSKFQISTSMVFEWQIETNNIKHVEFAEVPSETGADGSEITMAFKENYYQKYDIFRIDKSRQQCQVVSRPIRKRDDYWEVQVRLIDNNYDTTLDTDSCQIGDTTTFQSVAMPELSEEGRFSEWLSKNIFNCWEISSRQSAAKSWIIQAQREVPRNVQRLVRYGRRGDKPRNGINLKFKYNEIYCIPNYL